MVNPRESANAKIARAEETAVVLLHEIELLLKANPQPFLVTGELREGTNYVFTAHGALDVPVRFAVLFGEIMYHLRTALDHLLSALVRANGALPTDNHQFPIASTPEKFVQALKRGDIKGVSQSAEAIIESLQPYHVPASEPALLNVLREFNNVDKHRALVVVGGGAAIANQLVIEESDGPITLIGMSPPFVRKITEGGAQFFEINLGERHDRFHARIGCRPAIVVENLAPLECATVHEVVAKMVGFIKHAVGQFETEFK